MENKLQQALTCLKEKIGDFVPEIAIVPGSGWDKFTDLIRNPVCVEYADLPFFPEATYHKGVFIFGEIEGVKVVSAGRLHYYEGIPIEETVMPVRLLRMLGVKKLILTNASGGINPDYKPGSFMAIEDHIKFGVPSPLHGKNLDSLGVRFPDMSEVYSKRFLAAVFRAAERVNIPLHKGVYLQTAGPQFETPAEIRMMGRLGADAVGMSTVPEAIAAVHCGMEIAGISCISNMAAGISEVPLTIDDIVETSQRVIPLMQKLLRETVIELAAL